MCRLITIAFGLGLSVIVLLSLAPGSFGYKLEHNQAMKENKVEEPIQRPLNEKEINEINYCIMGCVKCANGDIYFKDESVRKKS